MPESEAVLQSHRSCIMRGDSSATSSSCLLRVSCSLARESASLSLMASTMDNCCVLNCSSSAFRLDINWLAFGDGYAHIMHYAVYTRNKCKSCTLDSELDFLV